MDFINIFYNNNELLEIKYKDKLINFMELSDKVILKIYKSGNDSK